MTYILYYLIFPGFLFTAVMGLLVSWIDRKVTARVQWRKGPPWYQNLLDFIKLLGKETIVPAGANKFMFFASPLIGFASVILASCIIWFGFLWTGMSFIGDWVVVIYLLTIPSISLILGGFASANPLASLGASREIKLILSYEFPFILACLVPVIKADGAIKLGEIVNFQAASGINIFSFSGILAFFVALMCLQAKLGLVPFDIAEAEQEIMAGVLIEYSGQPLAVFKLAKQMLLFVAPMFLVLLFMPKPIYSIGSFVNVMLKYVLILVLIILLRNTNPRVRIDQAIRFFWGKMSILALAAVVLALLEL